MSHGHKHTKDVINRLKRIGGHVQGVVRMVEQHKSCDEVLHQISAIRAAVSKVGQIIIDDHFEECIMGNIEGEDLRKEMGLFRNSLRKINF